MVKKREKLKNCIKGTISDGGIHGVCWIPADWHMPWPLGYYGTTRPMVYLCNKHKDEVYQIASERYEDWEEYRKEIETKATQVDHTKKEPPKKKRKAKSDADLQSG